MVKADLWVARPVTSLQWWFYVVYAAIINVVLFFLIIPASCYYVVISFFKHSLHCFSTLRYTSLLVQCAKIDLETTWHAWEMAFETVV